VADYIAVKEGELTVSKGDVIQLLGYTGQMYHVCRPSTNDDGLVPSHVLKTKDVTDNGIRSADL